MTPVNNKRTLKSIKAEFLHELDPLLKIRHHELKVWC